MANLTWALAGGGTARRTVGDEDPRRRRWLVAEGGDTRSGRLGDASNGPRWTRRSTGWRLLAPAGLQRAARRRTEGAAVVRRKGALGVVWRESERGAGGLYGVRRVRERGTGAVGVVTRLNSEIVAAAESRSASRRNRRAVGEEGAGVWVQGVSGGRGAGGSLGRFGPSDRTERSDRATRRWAGLTRGGPGGRGGKGGFASWAGRRRRERERRRFGPGRIQTQK